MSRYWRHKKYQYHPKDLTKKETFQWILTAVIFTVFFILYFVEGFVFNCIFEWPIRWDIKTCWNEQVDPAKDKAAGKAANFIP